MEVYQYNPFSIRVRVTDPAFRGKSVTERERMVEPLIEELPESVQRQILFLLMVTPEERDDRTPGRFTMMNLEFEDPSPSLL